MQLRSASTAAAPKLIVDQHSPKVVEFRMNSPKTLNSLDNEMIETIIPHLYKWKREPDTAPKAVFISGEGGKAFCAGGDIVQIYQANYGEKPESIKATFFAREYLLDYSLATMAPT